MKRALGVGLAEAYPENLIQQALMEIYSLPERHQCTANRKSLHKYGRFDSVGTSLVDINFGGYELVHSATNSIDTMSSSSGSDTQVITIEGMTISGGDYTFRSQTATLDGQNKVTLTTPLAVVTRIRSQTSATPTVGNVFVYEDGAITGGIPDDTATIGNVMEAVGQSTFAAGTSIASTNYFVMTGWYAYLNKKTDAQADVHLRWGDNDKPYVTREVKAISRGQGIDTHFTPYQIIKPNSNIDIQALASTTGVDITAGFYGFFADIQ